MISICFLEWLVLRGLTYVLRKSKFLLYKCDFIQYVNQ